MGGTYPSLVGLWTGDHKPQYLQHIGSWSHVHSLLVHKNTKILCCLWWSDFPYLCPTQIGKKKHISNYLREKPMVLSQQTSKKTRNLCSIESIPLLGMENFPLHAPCASRTNHPGSSTLPGSSVPPRPKTLGDAVGMRFSWGMTPPVLMGATQQVISPGVQSIKMGLQQIGS